MKVWIEGQETYPDYVFFVEGESKAPAEQAIEVDDETYARWVRVNEQYAEMQQELRALAEAEHKRWQQSIVASASKPVSDKASLELMRRMANFNDAERYGYR